MVEAVALEMLGEEGFGQVICYPACEREGLEKRLTEMRKLGVKALCFRGERMVNNVKVLGKGCVGIVVLAYTEAGRVALKIRRTDADRAGMKHEAQMLRAANSAGVGPRLLDFSENLLMMEFVDGLLIPRWIEALEEGDNARLRVERVLRDILDQCWRLDEAGLDHGELSQASKHIVIGEEDRPCILDFETASDGRRVSNVTSVCHFLFMSGRTSKLVGSKTEAIGREDLLATLKEYKKNRTRGNFEAILGVCLLQEVD